MPTLPRTSTTEMEVTSIRFERELKEKLKQLAGNQGYQALIRNILWDYVRLKSGEGQARVSPSEIQARIPATARQETRCALTGRLILPQNAMWLGLLPNGELVPLSQDSLAD